MCVLFMELSNAVLLLLFSYLAKFWRLFVVGCIEFLNPSSNGVTVVHVRFLLKFGNCVLLVISYENYDLCVHSGDVFGHVCSIFNVEYCAEYHTTIIYLFLYLFRFIFTVIIVGIYIYRYTNNIFYFLYIVPSQTLYFKHSD
jgi:hypothetical protein